MILLFTATCLVALGIAIGMYISSQIENHIDKNIKNRGRHNGKSHLTTQQVEEIRLIWYNTQGQTTNEFSTKICELYGVSRSAISCIIREKTWNYV